MALRIWIQVSARPVDTDSATVLFSVTRDLARPAELITGSPPLQETGVIDITTLVAMEAYFIATLAAIVLVLTYGEGRGILTARARKAPPFAAELEREAAVAAHRHRQTPRDTVLSADTPARRYRHSLNDHPRARQGKH
jgi:hypothetical protein